MLKQISYGARLPELSKTICQKLGGPIPPSPARPVTSNIENFSHATPKPGAVVQRAQPRKIRRTLERVLTNEKISKRPTASLSRSVTDSQLPKLKREHSETLLSTVPLDRVAVHQSKRYSQREIDLTAVAQAAAAKTKQKAEVEKELQGAIAALKKPNPRMAVKELVEAAERRVAGSKAKSAINSRIFGLMLIASRAKKSYPKSFCPRCTSYGYP